MPPTIPLSALLSQALVAFTIELDNEFERRMPHRTSDHGGTAGAPWAASLLMWSNFMRLVDDDGVTVAELTHRTRATPHLSGMQRWGYVIVAPDPADPRAKPPERDLVVRPTAAGRRAKTVWGPLGDQIEQRWAARFGAAALEGLRSGLEPLAGKFGAGLPQWLTGHYGGFANPPLGDRRPIDPSSAAPPLPIDPSSDVPPRNAADESAALPLSALLSRPLHAFALEYEQGSKVSLQYAANVIRLLDQDGLPPSEVSRRSGVAIVSIRTALGVLAKRGDVALDLDRARGRGKLARLTERGLRAQRAYPRRAAAIEQAWRSRFGAEEIARVRRLLEAVVLAPGGGRSPLFAGLDPPAGSWRSKVRPAEVLPHYPMPRQGGHPDGT